MRNQAPRRTKNQFFVSYSPLVAARFGSTAISPGWVGAAIRRERCFERQLFKQEQEAIERVVGAEYFESLQSQLI